MVRILKQGMPPGERKFQVTCKSCRSELEFKASEAAYTNDQRDGEFWQIQCPVCSDRVFGYANNIVPEPEKYVYPIFDKYER
jgi:ribosomal protein S27E